MKQVTLLPQDFNSFNLDSLDEQFSDNNDCPMARAIKRRLKTQDVRMGVYSIIINNNHHNLNKKVGWTDIQELAIRVKNNGKAIWKFGQEIN